MVNKGVRLARNVLLLGYSKKARHKDVIGQFGEGMKIGVLALLREGRAVSVLTAEEEWRFCFARDEVFSEERVLTVFIEDREENRLAKLSMGSSSLAGRNRSEEAEQKKKEEEAEGEGMEWMMEAEDTVTIVSPLEPHHWDSLCKRFLFLEKPQDCIGTELGTLLLDPTMDGDLYVKGVWITNLKEDGLRTGVDMQHLRLDRDRRAVLHISDLEHQVSSMWLRALDVRPDLVGRYFDMLSSNDLPCDVKHASFYMDDSRQIRLMANHFFRTHGSNAFPVSSSVPLSALRTLEEELNRKAIICNSHLLQILSQCGELGTLEALLADHNRKKRNTLTQKKEYIPWSALSTEEKDVLSHAADLCKLVLPAFALSFVDVVEWPLLQQKQERR
ncbi:RING finger protein B, partial [Balamuthia mandrillaris]